MLSLAAATRQVLELPYGLYHVAAGGEATWAEFAAAIFEAAGVRTGVMGTVAYRIGDRQLVHLGLEVGEQGIVGAVGERRAAQDPLPVLAHRREVEGRRDDAEADLMADALGDLAEGALDVDDEAGGVDRLLHDRQLARFLHRAHLDGRAAGEGLQLSHGVLQHRGGNVACMRAAVVDKDRRLVRAGGRLIEDRRTRTSMVLMGGLQATVAKIKRDIRAAEGKARTIEASTIDYAVRKKAAKIARPAVVRKKKLQRMLDSERLHRLHLTERNPRIDALDLGPNGRNERRWTAEYPYRATASRCSAVA